MNKKVSRRLSMVLAMVMMFSCVVFSNVSAMAAEGDVTVNVSTERTFTLNKTLISNTEGVYEGLYYKLSKTDSSTWYITDGYLRFTPSADCTLALTTGNNNFNFKGGSYDLTNQGKVTGGIYDLQANTEYTISAYNTGKQVGVKVMTFTPKSVNVYTGTVTGTNNSETEATVTVNGIGQIASAGSFELTFDGLPNGTYPITVDAAHELSGDTSVTISNGNGSASIIINDKSTGGETTETTTDVPVETTTEAPVSAGTLYKFYVNADDATSNGDNQSENANNIFPDAKTGTNSLSGSSTVTIEGKNYTFNKRGSNAAHVINISVPDNVTGATLYIVANSSGSGTRTLTLKDSSGAEAGTNTVAGAAGQLFSFSGLSTGAYTLTYGGNGGYSFLALFVPSAEEPTFDNRTDVIEGDVIANAKAVEIYGDVLSGETITENTLFARLIGAVNAKGSDELSGIDKVGFTFVNADMVDAWEAASGQKYNPNINESATGGTGNTVAAPSLKIDVETSNVYDAVYSIESYDASKVVNGRYVGEADTSAGVTEGRTYFEVLVYGSTDMRVYAYAYTNYAGSQTKTYTDNSGNPSVQVINISNGVISVSAKQ